MSEKQKRTQRTNTEKLKHKQKPKNEKLKRKQKPKGQEKTNPIFIWVGVIFASVLLLGLCMAASSVLLVNYLDAKAENKRFEETKAAIMTDEAMVKTWIAETATQIQLNAIGTLRAQEYNKQTQTAVKVIETEQALATQCILVVITIR